MLILFVILYFAITVGIGIYANGRISGGRDFINAGRNLHPVINAFALFALWFGSETLFGASAEFAAAGITGIIEDPLGGVLCLLLVGLLYARKMYRLNVLTLGDLFHRNFGRKIEMIASILMTLSFVGYIAAQLLALGMMLQMLLHGSLLTCMALALIIVLLYTTAGGMLAVSLTDFFQSIMIIIGLTMVAIFLTPHDMNWTRLSQSLPESHLRFWPENEWIPWLNWIASWMALGVGSIVSQDIFQRVNAARNEKSAMTSSLAGAGLYAIFSILPIYIVWMIYLQFPHINAELQMSLPLLVMERMPIGLQILFFGSVISAILSTCSGAILAPASLLAENIVKPLWRRPLSDLALLRITRASTVIIGVIALWVASGSEKIFDLVGTSSAFGVVSIFVPYTMALFFNAVSRPAALLSMVLGSTVWALCFFYLQTDINPTIFGLVASLLGWCTGRYIKE